MQCTIAFIVLFGTEGFFFAYRWVFLHFKVEDRREQGRLPVSKGAARREGFFTSNADQSWQLAMDPYVGDLDYLDALSSSSMMQTEKQWTFPPLWPLHHRLSRKPPRDRSLRVHQFSTSSSVSFATTKWH